MRMRITLGVVTVLALAARGYASERDSFPVFIQPGLEPRLAARDVVPTSLPEALWGLGLTGSIDSIERVVFVRLPSKVDPCLSAMVADSPVWVVIFRGKFEFSRWEAAHRSYERGYYLVDDTSGLRGRIGGCPAR